MYTCLHIRYVCMCVSYMHAYTYMHINISCLSITSHYIRRFDQRGPAASPYRSCFSCCGREPPPQMETTEMGGLADWMPKTVSCSVQTSAERESIHLPIRLCICQFIRATNRDGVLHPEHQTANPLMYVGNPGTDPRNVSTSELQRGNSI